jgi:hypothetical protein
MSGPLGIVAFSQPLNRRTLFAPCPSEEALKPGAIALRPQAPSLPDPP